MNGLVLGTPSYEKFPWGLPQLVKGSGPEVLDSSYSMGIKV